MMGLVDVSRLDADIDSLSAMTSDALQQTLTVVSEERRALQQARDRVDERVAHLDQMEASLRPLLNAQTSATSNGGSNGGSNGEGQMTRLLVRALEEQDRAVETSTIIDTLERLGHDVDPRGVTGALSAGVRAGRFHKTAGGRWRLTR